MEETGKDCANEGQIAQSPDDAAGTELTGISKVLISQVQGHIWDYAYPRGESQGGEVGLGSYCQVTGFCKPHRGGLVYLR